MWLTFSFMIISLMLVINEPFADAADPQVPCYFIFGDSLVDNGNNNRLPTLAKANYQPYGIDFPGGPTGRFTNGRNTADVIAELLGFENEIPPYATAGFEDLLRGVNYGSGSAGILPESGQHLGGRISLAKQLMNHQTAVDRISVLTRSKKMAKRHLSECLYTVGMGSNDYINNYFMPKCYPTRNFYTPSQYAEHLTQEYAKQLKVLYKLGARKIGVFALGKIGCTPAMVSMYGGRNGSYSCAEMVNDAIELFDERLRQLVGVLNNNLNNANFIYVNTSDVTVDPGFVVEGIPCCKISVATGQCDPNQVPCSNRKDYRFWDAFHPTEAANLVTGEIVYRSLSPFYTNLIDIR